MDLGLTLFLTIFELIVLQYLSLSSSNGRISTFEKISSLAVDGDNDNIVYKGDDVIAFVSFVDAIAHAFVRFVFLLNRFVEACVNSISESLCFHCDFNLGSWTADASSQFLLPTVYCSA